MNEDTFGTPEADFDYQFAQAQRATMDLDAMNREAILSDPLSVNEAQQALRKAYPTVLEEAARLGGMQAITPAPPRPKSDANLMTNPTDQWGDPI